MTTNISDYYMSDEKDKNIMNEYYTEKQEENQEDNLNNIDDILDLISKDSKNINDFIKANISNYEPTLNNQKDDDYLKKFIPITISFITWMKENKDNENLYKTFSNIYSCEYRTQLYENIIKYFNDEQVITDEFLVYWKLLVIDLIKNNRRHKHYIKNITIDLDNHTSNLRLDKEKGVFKCFLDGNYICFFKENGNDYYVS
ncbi:hypothetical protein [Moumouvirus maliensis]|nr:hypothetical protein [Moumouvirus maliensis]